MTKFNQNIIYKYLQNISMIQEPDSLEKRTREIRLILNQFKQFNKDNLSPDQVEQLFYSCVDELFAKNKTSLTEHEVQCLYDYFKVYANKHKIAVVDFDFLHTLQKSTLIKIDLVGDVEDPLKHLRNGTFEEILPFGVREFENEDIVKERFKQERYQYGYILYSHLPSKLCRAARRISPQAEIFIKIIQLRWGEAAKLFHKTQKTNMVFRSTYKMLAFVFDNLSQIQADIYSQAIIRRIIENKIDLTRIDPEREQFKDCRDKIINIQNSLQFISILCQNYTACRNPYMAAALYFISQGKNAKKTQFQKILNSQQLPFLVRFFFAKRFINEKDFNQLKNNLNKQILTTLNCEYLPIIRSESRIIKIIQNQLDEHNSIEKASILSMIMISKMKVGTSHNPLVSIVQTYFDYIKMSNERQVQLKLMKFYQELKYFNQQNEQDEILSLASLQLACISCGHNFIFSEKKTIRDVLDSKDTGKNLEYTAANKTDPPVSAPPPAQNQQNFNLLADKCPVCSCLNSACCVCLLPIQTYIFNGFCNDILKNKKDDQELNKPLKQLCESFDDSLTICPKCEHGGHFKHMKQWFESNPNVCPVYNCPCTENLF